MIVSFSGGMGLKCLLYYLQLRFEITIQKEKEYTLKTLGREFHVTQK